MTASAVVASDAVLYFEAMTTNAQRATGAAIAPQKWRGTQGQHAPASRALLRRRVDLTVRHDR
jgi:hypothetical protein